ncbi:hypothetical protein NQ314_007958 [Rhamnusium bicolor]|uniref:Inositol-pentakisphosphate 2-kinase n=1 Tax=Rhamnusium bicolor TaxID=1586634 RepID=A0AAV8YFP6_9CUCU|nr:hypothetical protein NQ314_007958 [Rhamnusium bicolor]
MLSTENKPITNFEMPSKWIYRGEGNCNVVLSLPDTRKILRIRKTDRPKTLIAWLIIWISDILYWYCGKATKEELRDLKFYSAIMRPLIGRKYTSEVNQVILTRKQIKRLEYQLSNHRPDFRQNKILQYGRAALFDDFAFLPQDEYEYLPFKVTDDTFAVEIKPKQGWKPLSEKHFPRCLFCMNQYLKKEKRQIKEISEYCPEDLFSGNAVRMKCAIKSLIENPQNNFRIFKNGVLCYGEKLNSDIHKILPELFETINENSDKLREEFYELIQKCLITNLINIDCTEECEEKLFCEWNKIIQEANFNTLLPKGCVLEKILSIQMLDTEGSYYYSKLLSKENLKDWSYVNMLLNRINNTNTCLKCTIMMLGNTHRKEGDLDLICVPYMISAIAKDCSLMITLKKIKENISDDLEMKNIMKTGFGHYIVNIGVFDLYPKPLTTTFKKHYKRNRDIFETFTKATEKFVDFTSN